MKCGSASAYLSAVAVVGEKVPRLGGANMLGVSEVPQSYGITVDIVGEVG